MVARGLSERRALTVGRMSASAFRYVPRPDGNAVVRDRIVDLAQRHRRYGAALVHNPSAATRQLSALWPR